MGYTRVLGVSSGVFLGALLKSSLLLAQAPSEHARAEALSDAALAARASGETEQECARLEASARLEPSASRLLGVAECNERLGKSATAWATYGRAAVLAGREGSAEEQARAQAEVARLEPALVRLSVVVPETHQLIGLEVLQDGVLVDPSLYGVGVAVDPGTHRLVARAPRHVSWSAEVGLPAAPGTVSITVPMLGLSVLPPALPPPVATPDAGAGVPGQDDPGAAQRTVGWVIGGTGLALVGGGVAAGLVAAKKRERMDRLCSNRMCAADLHDDLESFETARTASTLLFIAGGLSLVSGAVVYGVAPSARASSASLAVAPVVAPGTAGLLASGRF